MPFRLLPFFFSTNLPNSVSLPFLYLCLLYISPSRFRFRSVPPVRSLARSLSEFCQPGIVYASPRAQLALVLYVPQVPMAHVRITESPAATRIPGFNGFHSFPIIFSPLFYLHSHRYNIIRTFYVKKLFIICVISGNEVCRQSIFLCTKFKV